MQDKRRKINNRLFFSESEEVLFIKVKDIKVKIGCEVVEKKYWAYKKGK